MNNHKQMLSGFLASALVLITSHAYAQTWAGQPLAPATVPHPSNVPAFDQANPNSTTTPYILICTVSNSSGTYIQQADSNYNCPANTIKSNWGVNTGNNGGQNPSQTLTQIPADAAGAQGASILVSGYYPTAAGYSSFSGRVPLSEFATASSVNALSLASDIETNRALAAEASLNKTLSDQTKAATAISVALGGMGFIPGKRMNLTMNMGAYEGKTAFAVQGAYVLNNNAYVNFAVAGGTKEGGTAYRSGVTFGW